MFGASFGSEAAHGASAVEGSRDRAQYIERHWARFLNELAEFVRFPTVSAGSLAHSAAWSCVRWLHEHLRRLGASTVRVFPGRNYPTVFATIRGNRHAPGVIIYGHYDVQPPEPLTEWKTAPFEPIVRNGCMYGRGVSDDKGQLFAHLKSVEMLRALGEMPSLNVAFLIDGEEEVGSPALGGIVDALDRDVDWRAAVVSDTPILGLDRPSITHALRGDLYLEFLARSKAGDLHSGNFGGTVDNTLEALIGALASLHDRTGAIAVDGFYDDVATVPWSERAYMRRVGPTAREIRRESGGARITGEPQYTAYERLTIRPSIEVSGLRGGHLGVGVKGVIPSRATAKLDIRTVPNQDPDLIKRRVFDHLRQRLPRGTSLDVAELMRVSPIVLERQHPVMRVASRAYETGFGRAPAFVRLGGSIPIVSLLEQRLGVPSVLMGLSLPSDGAHAANEHWPLSLLRRGIQTSAAFLTELGRIHP